ncbi:MAG: Fic family protein [Rhizobiales bacterium]|nr:Fic family protein [Hyphomicrobiales bacterium]
MLKSIYSLPSLPPPRKLETEAVLRAAAGAHRRLAEVKGRATAIPNPGILIDTLSLQEARASSEIENIVTTQDEMFQAVLFPDGPDRGPAKEVALYRDALRRGWDLMREKQNLLTNNIILEMFRILKGTSGGFRETPGTALKNDATGAIVYVPPQDRNEIIRHMTALESFINTDDDVDPLVKMALIHHQFESIHPLPDGNGRIGRIVNVLYLARSGLLELPILYLSRYITTHKPDYYRLLQAVRDKGAWEEWILYMLRAVQDTSLQTLELIQCIGGLMATYKHRIRSEHPRIYSQDLLNNLFRHPYTRIEFVQNELDVSRQTAAKYLDQLSAAGIIEKRTAGKHNYYINGPLVDLFLRVSRDPTP